MLDPQIACYLMGFIAISSLLYKNRQIKKLKALIGENDRAYANSKEVLQNSLAEKNKILATEYMNRKNVQELLEATTLEANSAKAKMLELNDVLIESRSDIKDLNEEIERLHAQLEVSQGDVKFLRQALDKSAKLSVTTAKRVAKKSVKKKKRG